MKCITCKKEVKIDKETKQPEGASSIIILSTPSSKHGGKMIEHRINLPQSYYRIDTNPDYGVLCDNCYSPSETKKYNDFIASI